jgi:LysR family transcriptional activator of nhaA
METLNFHYLRLFWGVAREGHLTRASAKMHLTPQTVSTQIRKLEQGLGVKLFHRSGRRLILTEAGHTVMGYADEIFLVGDELLATLEGKPTGRPLRFIVGLADVLPKLVAYRLLRAARGIEEPIRLVCREGKPKTLLAELSVHGLDLVLSDAPVPPRARVRAYNHALGECGVTFMARAELARKLRRGFPKSLDGAPLLMPSEDAILNRELHRWFDQHGVRPAIVGEFDDSALLKAFGQEGAGFFAIPAIIEAEVARQYRVRPVGVAQGIIERFYAISLERRIRHPAVTAICDMAKTELFS